MPYDHYLFDMPDMSEALEQMNNQREKIVGMFAIPETQQVCIVVERDHDKVERTLKQLFEKDDDYA